MPASSAESRQSSFWFHRLARPIIFLTLSLAIAGAYLAFSIPVSVFPNTDFPRIVVGVDNGVMPIDQMLVTITRPLEEAMNSVPGLNKVYSITSRGSAELDLFFDWSSDMVVTLQRVDAVVARLQTELPPTAKIETHRLTFASFPILGYSLTSDTIPQNKLWEIATYDIKPRINRLDGVASVLVQGGRVPEFQVMPDPARLLASNVTVPDILDAIRRTNLIDSPGLLEHEHQLVLSLVSGQVRTPEEISQIVVKTSKEGVPIRIGDIASVTPSQAPVYTIVTANGKAAVLLSINRQPDSNTLDVANAVHRRIAELRSTLPPGVHLETFYDQSTIVQQSIASVRDAVLLGIILSAAIIVLFLRDWGTSFVAALVIPVTLLFTFIVLRLTGQSFNLMTLGGLAAAVGLVIDDAIVVLENIVLHRDAGELRFRAIQNALREITIPLVGSTITPIVVFLPLISTTGVFGSFFRALAITMTVALLSSLVLAVTWTPTLSQYLVRRRVDRCRSEVTPSTERAKDVAASDRRCSPIRFLWPYRGFLFTRDAQDRASPSPGWSSAACSSSLSPTFAMRNLDPISCRKWMKAASFSTTTLLREVRSPNPIEFCGTLRKSFAPLRKSKTRRDALVCSWASPPSPRPIAVISPSDSRKTNKRPIDEIMADIRNEIRKTEPATDVEFVQILQDMIGDLTSRPEPVVIKLFSADPKLLEASATKRRRRDQEKSETLWTSSTALRTPSAAPPSPTRSIPWSLHVLVSLPKRSPSTPRPSWKGNPPQLPS